MKENIIKMAVMAVAFIAFYSCKRDFIIKTGSHPVDSSLAYLKVVHAAPFFRQTSGGMRDSFNIFLNGAKVNGTFLTYNSLFPVSVNQSTNSITNTYFAVTPGSQQIKLSIPGVVSPDSVPILTLTKTFSAGKFYTLMITDSIMSARDSSQIFVQDVYTIPLQGYINIRLIHAALNDTLGKTIDLFSYAKNANILTKVKPGDISAFQLVGYNLQTVDTFYIRRNGTNAVLTKLAFTTTGTGAANQRTFTLYYKGDANLSSGTKARALASYINQ